MKDNIFFDTNILLYLYTATEPKKQLRVFDLMLEAKPIVSLQVLKEFSNILHKKMGYDWTTLSKVCEEILKKVVFINNELSDLKKAYHIAMKYQYSFYDSFIIASALESNSSIIYTEDLQHKQRIEDKLTIVNPFV